MITFLAIMLVWIQHSHPGEEFTIKVRDHSGLPHEILLNLNNGV